MKLIKLTPYNYCQFVGRNTIKFAHEEKGNVTIIIGGGGSGKTNIMRAIIFCL